MLLLTNPWWLAIRPRTIPASIAPVLLGTAMAFGDGIAHWPSALLALLGAVLIQVGTNLANDYYDFVKGVDGTDRKGPVRVTQAGLISPQNVRRGFIIAFALAALIGCVLTSRAGWPIAVVGVLSILSGIFYTAGTHPLSHLGLGEIFVLIFFGPVAVAGTYYVQSFEMNAAVLLMGLACGFWSTAVLCVNNLRDIETDRRAGKRTLAVRFGNGFAKGEYLFCILAACAVPPAVFLVTGQHAWTLATSLLVFWAIPLINAVYIDDDASKMNMVLGRTGVGLMLYVIIFSLAWIL